jgi:tight adherence protein C
MVFAVTTIAAIAAGLLLSELYRRTLLGPLVSLVVSVPGGLGEIFAAILGLGPWIILVIGSLLPTLIVRAARRARVRALNQDLPLALELFATMAEAGLGFDAALTRIVGSQSRERPLVSELATFQSDLLAGVPRVQAFRHLARRVDMSAVHTFTSAVIQAEQVGASIAETLRHQAEDMRNRRREGALLLAQALPVKLMFPLVICFLPGIFVSTLAPVIYQMIQVADSVLRTAGQ